jgi:single-stranded-DNA-specific exonuclease
MRAGARWVLAPPCAGSAELARRLRTSPLVAQLLHNRGLDSPQAVAAFLDPKLTDLHPPELMAGMEAASARIIAALRAGQRICLYGDYDVDGMTGLAILYRCLSLRGGQVEYYVPHRIDEGYGLNLKAVEKIAAGGAKLLVTVDCGVTAVEAVARANQLGLDVIVTDHHAPDAALPAALAIVHPALPGGTYPNANLSGSGVAFKLAWHLSRSLVGGGRVDEPTRRLLLEATTLAALGTIADVVPLLGENRVLAAYGLRGLVATEHVGLRALVESAGLVGERLDAYHVGFCLAPRLNACGRMGHARVAVELLTRADAERCRRIAEGLEKTNTQRQQVERDILQQALEVIERDKLAEDGQAALVLAGEGWHAGVIGIVAARLVDRFCRPTVMIALANGQGQGSARSIDGFHMRDALAACSVHLASFGGHAMAGGLRLSAQNVGAFARAFCQHARANLSPDQLTPVLNIEAVVRLSELSLPVVRQLEKLGPFGRGNPNPVVMAPGVRLLTAPQRMGRSGSTVSFIAAQDAAGTGRTRCVGFGMAEMADRLSAGSIVDIAGRAVINRFNGRESVEFHLQDLRPAGQEPGNAKIT